MTSRFGKHWRAVRRGLTLLALACALAASGACQQVRERMGGAVRPRALRDVPAARLAFRFEPDTDTTGLGALLDSDEAEEPLAPVKEHFDTQRKDDALLRTVVSPDGLRALALYATTETAEGDFRMDLYSSKGEFLRNVMPPELTGTFPQHVVWSADSQNVAFIGIKNPSTQATPTPPPALTQDAPAPDLPPGTEPTPAPTVAPIIAPVQVFGTEQVYVCDRDGLQLRPLTSRDGLIYFKIAWAPDGHALAALACTPAEWDARRNEDKEAAGRPRLLDLEGKERLLSDQLADAAPDWSPDSSKVATAFETTVAVYDAAAGDAPTGANIPLGEPLLAASARYDVEQLKKQPAETPLSFNPVVRIEWVQPETAYLQTAFVRIYKNGEPVTNYVRWHVLHLSPQAVVLAQ